MKKITYILLLLFAFNFSYGQVVAWEMNGNAGNEATVNATTLDANLNTSTLSRGSGVNPTTLANAFSSNTFTNGGTQANAITNNEYLQYQVSASSGYQVSLSTLDAIFRRSNTGPNTFIWRYSTDGVNFTDIGTSFSYNVNAGNGTSQAQINLSTIPALQNVAFGTTITFRLYGWGATNTGGTFAIGRLAGNDLSLGGTVAALPSCASPTVTWTAGAWSPLSGPTINTPVIITDNYDTASFGSFSACTLTVDSSFLLRVNDGTFVEVENDATVDGQLFVDNQGNFVQNSDAAIFTDNTTNGVLVSKTKTVQNKFIYTYWSSPISNGTIVSTFSTVPADKRFSFNATNFVDLLEEIGNTNTFLPNAGVDDQDDDGNDWEYASGAMAPGVGYAMRTNEFGPAFPRPETFDFIGEFNNGVVQVPLINNSGGLYNDWNFVGNPYPSAINASQFFTVNTGIVDVIYLWDQATPLDSNASGNQVNNYSASDYAMINRSGAISGGGAGTIPNGSIASGQGFFVEALAASNLTFNNSMRTIGTIDNGQFFKNSKTKSNTTIANKLWVSLTTDNGAFNQILVSYIGNATSENDGSAYDAKRVVSSGNSTFLYSNIENDDDKFAIQGKAPSDLNENEIIDLGFKTIIDVATSYTLSIAQLQGDFLNNNTVYLKDNLLDKTHNLSDSDYTFTSEVGEFNNRFQIAFTDKSLSTDDINLNDNNLTIIELGDDQVNFKTSNSLSIKTVTIYDLLGRQLYNFKGKNNSSEIYELSNLKSSVYIAKVELSNGITVTKKAIKK